MKRQLSDLAIHKLLISGIDEKNAKKAGMFSVENAKRDFDREFSSRPALVIPYYDVYGEPIYFDRDGDETQFVRVRYLDKLKANGFTRKKSRRYAQLKGSGVHPYFPIVINWKDISENPSLGIIITEGELKALAACIRGYPTIGLGGVDNFVARVK